MKEPDSMIGKRVRVVDNGTVRFPIRSASYIETGPLQRPARSMSKMTRKSR